MVGVRDAIIALGVLATIGVVRASPVRRHALMPRPEIERPFPQGLGEFRAMLIQERENRPILQAGRFARVPSASGFLAVGPMFHPRAGLPATVGGLLPQTPWVQYLEARRALDPARFDHYHPRVGPLLAEDQARRNPPQAQQITPTQLVIQPTPPVPPAVGPIVPSPPQLTVPEPSTGLIGLILIASTALARRCRRTLAPGRSAAGVNAAPV